MRNKLGRSAVSCATILWIALAGCGGGGAAPQPVSGTVSVKGGKPLTKGTIRFTSVGTKIPVSAVGIIDKQGAFKLSFLGKDDGAPAGDYTVTLTGTETGQDYDHPDEPVTQVISEKYDNDTATDLKYTVKPGNNVCKFEVDPPTPKQ